MLKSNSLHPEAARPAERSATLESKEGTLVESPYESRVVWAIVIVAIAITSFPFLFGMFLDGPNHRFVGQVYNVDDYCVYSSWANQIAHGSVYLRNLFTNEPQLGHQINIYFLILGNIVRLTHIPLPWVMATVRILAGIALLSLTYRFYRSTLTGSSSGRMLAMALTALGTGFGYFYANLWWSRNNFRLPVDTWQPEAFPFLSLDTSGLFVVGMLLIVGTIWLLLEGERTGRARYAVCAGICGLVMGNMHSYDILHVVAAWGLFLIVRDLMSRRLHGASWGRAVVAGLIAMPSVVIQYYLFKHDPVFHARAADTFTRSQGVMTYVLGYGLTLLLAIVGVVLAVGSKRFAGMWRDRDTMILPICWATAAFILVYLPSAFQRKMIMGVDFPLTLLAGAAVAQLTIKLPAPRRRAVFAAVLLLSIPTGILFICRDIRHAWSNSSETASVPYLSNSELDLFKWISTNTGSRDTILGPPNLMIYVPGYCERTVWCGHWSETMNYAGKYRAYAHFSNPLTSDDDRRAFLASTHAQYLVAPTDAPVFPSIGAGSAPYLQPVYENQGYVVYSIHPARGIVACLPDAACNPPFVG